MSVFDTRGCLWEKRERESGRLKVVGLTMLVGESTSRDF